MSVKDLVKYGYVVELRNGSSAIIMPTEEEDYLDFCDNVCCLKFSNYDENLCYRGESEKYDVMKIFGYSKYGYRTFCNNRDGRELIWKREPEFSIGSRVKIVNMNDFDKNDYILIDEYIGKTGRVSFDLKNNFHTYKIDFDKNYMNAIDQENGILLFSKENLELIDLI